MADIVERLRGLVATCGCGACNDAADEIARLRSALDEASKACASFVQGSERLRAENESLREALESLTKDPPASLAREPDDDAEVVIKMRAIAREALTNGQS